MDVVPAGSGWDTTLTPSTIKDGRLYAREPDDKGPTTACCFFGLKIIKEFALHLRVRSQRRNRRRIRLQTWTTTEHVGLAEPDFGFSPDADSHHQW